MFTENCGKRTQAGSLLDAAIQGYATGLRQPMHNGNHVILWKRTTKAVQTYRVKLLEWPWDYLASERVLVLMLFAFSEGYYQGSNALRHSR